MEKEATETPGTMPEAGGSRSVGAEINHLGHKVGAALVGTFLGVLMCYGFLQPFSAQIEYQAELEELYMHSIKAGVEAYAKGMPPIVAVEFARRVIVNEFRPTFAEVEEACRAIKVKA
jgi:chemotaxis protein MotA